MNIGREFRKKYSKLNREEKEHLKDSLGVIFQLEFLKRKLKERKSWIKPGEMKR